MSKKNFSYVTLLVIALCLHFRVPTFGDSTVWERYTSAAQDLWNFDGGNGAGAIGRGQPGQAILSDDAAFWNNIILPLARAEFTDELRALLLGLINGA